MRTQKLYTAKEASELLNVHKYTVVRWLKSGLIPACKVGFGIRAEWRIEHDDLMVAVNNAQKKAA